MTSITFSIKFYPGKKNRIIVPRRYFHSFRSIRSIQYGPYHSEVEVLSHHKDRHTLYISSQLKAKLNFSNNKKLTLQLQDNTCIIVLTLGIYLAGFDVEQSPLGPRTDLFELMSQAGDKLGFKALFFGHQHVLPETDKINAYHYQDNVWKQEVYNFPTVIYNRIPNRKIEHHPDVVQIKKRLRDKAVLFNDGFFNKWEIYELLMKSPESYLLPETILHPSERKITRLLSNHSLYIKPIHGSRGDGIYRCRQIETGELECHYYHKDQPQVNRYKSMDIFFRQQFPNGLKGFVVQKEIPLLKKGRSAIDFRVHVNKNYRNSWEVTLIGAKFAGKGSLTTHVQRGGTIHTVEELFTKDKARHITDKLTKTALLLSHTIEEKLEQPIGEIGFDIGIDEEGKSWLFEANSKPGFSIFDHSTLKKQAMDVLSYPFQYAFYLHNLKMKQINQE